MGKGKNWTPEEYAQLAELWGQFSVGAIAKRLNRSEHAILIKVHRLGLGSHLSNSERITLNALFKEIGWTGGTAYKRMLLENGGMKIHTQKVRNNSFRMVDIDEFWEFAEKNPFMFDFSKLAENALGAEPEWVKVKRAEDFKRAQALKPNNTPWTQEEDNLLLSLLRGYRYTYPEIATRMRRTDGAIRRRLSELGVKERPLPADNHTLWTAEEFQTIGRMIKAGSSYETMSEALGKSAKAIRGRVYTMYLTENLNKVRKLIGDGEWGNNRPERTIGQRLLMTIEEKEQTKETLSKLAGIIAYRCRQHFDDQDNWQREICQNWDPVKGCTVGGENCDSCADFARIRPQNCARCGATFYERKENRICERCRVQRKKQAAHKYFIQQERKERRRNNGEI